MIFNAFMCLIKSVGNKWLNETAEAVWDCIHHHGDSVYSLLHLYSLVMSKFMHLQTILTDTAIVTS